MFKETIDQIQKLIEKKEQISPFLFLSQNLKILNQDLSILLGDLQKIYTLPSSYIMRLEDDGESLKIAQTRTFIEKSHVKPDYPLQIFVIENIGRFTNSAGNSLLKFFEEPGVGNLILLTNTAKSGVLDTILSRVQTVNHISEKKEQFIEYVEEMIKKYVENNNPEIFSYYFVKQFEKLDGFHFLYALISYIKKTGKFSDLLTEITSDLDGLGKNNLNGKFIVDKYLLKLKRD